MTSFDVKRKRPWWFGWLPAAVLVVLITGVGITTAIVANSGLGKPAPEPTVGEVTELNWSSFTKEGLAYIERSRNVRIDLSRPTDASALGLPADGTVTIGPSDNAETDNDYYLIVNGGGEGHGGTKLTVTQLDIVTADGAVSQIRAVTSASLPFRMALNDMSGNAEEFGWPAPDTTALFAQVAQASKDNVGFEFTLGPGDRLGITVSATATCQTSGFCAVEYDVTPSVR